MTKGQKIIFTIGSIILGVIFLYALISIFHSYPYLSKSLALLNDPIGQCDLLQGGYQSFSVVGTFVIMILPFVLGLIFLLFKKGNHLRSWSVGVLISLPLILVISVINRLLENKVEHYQNYLCSNPAIGLEVLVHLAVIIIAFIIGLISFLLSRKSA